jgi:hypothetical protein
VLEFGDVEHVADCAATVRLGITVRYRLPHHAIADRRPAEGPYYSRFDSGHRVPQRPDRSPPIG